MEVEAKFCVEDAAALARLTATAELAGYAVDPGGRRRDHDTFFDTPSRCFLTAGYYLRRRETDSGVRYTLKGLAAGDGGVLRREELEALVAADLPLEEWPQGDLATRVRDIAAGEPLEPFLFLEQERLARPVRDGEREVAELSLDDVTAAVSGRSRRWFELELELRGGGDERDLALLTEALREDPALTPEGRAKFSRALDLAEAGDSGSLMPPTERPLHERHAAGGDARARRAAALLALDDGHDVAAAAARAGLSSRRVRHWLARYRAEGLAIYGRAGPTAVTEAAAGIQKHRRPGITAADSMSRAAVKTLRFHLQRMVEREAGTRLGEDPEELHVMRVSTRRLRMALRVFDEYLDADAVRPLLKGLRRTGRTLGAVRDLDVFAEKTRSYIDGLPDSRASELDGLLEACAAERERQRRRLVAYLDGARYREFVERAGELLDGPLERVAAPPPADHRPQRVAQVLPGVLYQDMAAVWAFEGLLEGPAAPLPQYHALRRACKGLRYTLEFFEDVLGVGARPLIKKVKRLQDHLGDLQDAVVTCGILRDFITWGTWRHAGHDLPAPTEVIVAPGVARYLVSRQEEMERLIAGFPEVWPTVAGGGFSRELATVIAEI